MEHKGTKTDLISRCAECATNRSEFAAYQHPAFSPVGQKRKKLIYNFIIINKDYMKNKELRFRVSTLEYDIIKNKISKTGLSISEFLRRLALGLELKNKLTDDEVECYRNLSKFSDNFRRISNLFKVGDVTGMKNETLYTSRLIREHLEKLK